MLKAGEGIGADKRIGRDFLSAGLGFGGSCFPKDIAAFIAISDQLGIPFNLLKEVQNINSRQLECFLDAIREALWVSKDKKLAVWGLAFKPNTDDVRSSVAVSLVERLVAEGADVNGYDPKAMEKARGLSVADKIKFAESPLEQPLAPRLSSLPPSGPSLPMSIWLSCARSCARRSILMAVISSTPSLPLILASNIVVLAVVSSRSVPNL